MKTTQQSRKLAWMAMLVAVYVVLSLYGTLRLGNMKLTVDAFPIILGALIFGPVGGMTIGLLGSFLNQMLTYGMTITTVLWIIPAGVRGLMVGLYAMKKGVDISPKSLAFIVMVSSLVVTTLNTVVMYVDSVVYGYYSFAYVFGALVIRYVTGLLTAVLYTATIYPLLRLLKNAVPGISGGNGQRP